MHSCLIFVVGGETDSEPGTEGDQDGNEQEGDMARREHSLKDEHAHSSDASYGRDRGDTSRSQESGDHAAAMGNILGSALTYQLHQPQIYKAIGLPLLSLSLKLISGWSHGVLLQAAYHLSRPNCLDLLRNPSSHSESLFIDSWVDGLLCKLFSPAHSYLDS